MCCECRKLSLWQELLGLQEALPRSRAGWADEASSMSHCPQETGLGATTCGMRAPPTNWGLVTGRPGETEPCQVT